MAARSRYLGLWVSRRQLYPQVRSEEQVVLNLQQARKMAAEALQAD
jgi:hypothetical protein